MLRWILALLFIPFLDAVLLAVVVSQTHYLGWVGMVALVVLTGLIGMLLVRAEGRRTLRKTQRSLQAGKPPTNELFDAGLLIAAGAFLLTPGLVTDLLGFLLVVPITRIPIRAALKRFVVVPYLDKQTDGLTSGVVWTAGFPDEETSRASWSGGGFPGGASRGDGDSSRPGDARKAADGAAGGTVDLGEDAYTVDTGEGTGSSSELESDRGRDEDAGDRHAR